LPSALLQHLQLKLHKNAGMIYREARSLRKEDDFSERGQFLLPHVKVTADHMWESKLSLYDEAFHLAFTPTQARNNDFLNGNDNSGLEVNENDAYNPTVPMAYSHPTTQSRKQSRWDAVQEAFFGVYVELLSNYRRCLVFPSKDEKTNSDGSSTGSSYGGAGFRSREFLKSQRSDKRQVLEELIKTQMFDEFVTKRLYGVSASDIIFFDNAIDRFSKRKARTLDTSALPSLNPSAANSVRSNFARPNSAPVESSMRRLLNRVTGSSNVPIEDDEPLLQSAKVHRKLKTVVPPEPSGEGLDDEDDELNIGYTYSSFPTKFDRLLFSTPRPLPPAVLAEFDRQQDDAAQFRRGLKKHLKKRDVNDLTESEMSPEITTFTVFLVAFTAMIGKELVELSQNAHECKDERQILATFTEDTTDIDSDVSTEDKEINDDDSFRIERRFKDPLSNAQIEEAKATASAQLNLAFEILDIMTEREMKTDPVAYKCLIDACGRCGDTERATRLLTRMHEDGIVADGVVYSCLVSAFSVESTYGNLPNKSSHIPEWANGASAELDWNRLENKYLRNNPDSESDPANGATRAEKLKKKLTRYIEARRTTQDDVEEKKNTNAAEILGESPTKDRFVTEIVANQIGFGENLLELVYPGKSWCCSLFYRA
jgi:pentatricopeptide repeat protein